MAWDLNNIYNFKDTEKLVSQLKNKVNNYFKDLKNHWVKNYAQYLYENSIIS